ncbi:MAG TPA: ABC transporter permease [Frankiaceae bacterium]|jgi:ABC-type transport system involved in multi-copper enzyme maturation permease subunit|nr:ABC transporter permease [Frankiaceae bacterium]
MSTLTTFGSTQESGSIDRVRGSLLAEWTKFRSLRANRVALFTAFVSVVGIGIIVSAATVKGWDTASAADRAAFDPVAIGLSGGGLAQLIIGVLGVLLISSEFSSGTIRSTFAAVPDRRLVLASKTAVLATVTFAVSLASALAAFLISERIFDGKHLEASFSDPGVARAVIGGALYLTGAGVLGLAIASLLRHTAAAIGTLVAVLLVLPSLVGFLPGSLAHNVGRYLPSNAGSAVIKLNPDKWDMAPWTGLALFFGYALAALAVGAVMLRRRDV